ncbi:MAG TPA: zf-HC2 domain-containing protein [Acidobacteriota bacterium]|nr:zf-HC2 domain-containing protein [Acidobacteriota bacterium]
MSKIEKGPQCFSIEELAAFAEETAKGARRREIDRHLASCPACRTELALLEEFHNPALSAAEEADVEWIAARIEPPAQAAPAAPVTREGFWQRLLRAPMLPAAGLAASLLLAVLAGLLLWRSPAPLPPLDPVGEDVLRSDALELRQPLGVQAGVPSALQWQAVPNASYYQVSLLRVDSSLVWQQRSESVILEIPPNVRSQMGEARRFYWQVTAHSANGDRLAASEVASFRIQAR